MDDTQSLIADRRRQWNLLTPEQQSQRIQNAVLHALDAKRRRQHQQRLFKYRQPSLKTSKVQP